MAYIIYAQIPLARSHMPSSTCKEGWEMKSLARGLYICTYNCVILADGEVGLWGTTLTHWVYKNM